MGAFFEAPGPFVAHHDEMGAGKGDVGADDGADVGGTFEVVEDGCEHGWFMVCGSWVGILAFCWWVFEKQVECLPLALTVERGWEWCRGLKIWWESVFLG